MFHEFLKQNNLSELLPPPGEYAPFPQRQDRAAWIGLPENVRDELLQWGWEASAGYPPLTATQFLSFTRDGSRQAYEVPYFQRRRLLMGAVLAECAADDGSCLDFVIDGLWCICEESTWVISAHNSGSYPGAEQRPLPDTDNPYIDLFAAQTAATLAYTLYLLEDKLDAVTPLLARRVRRELDRRIVTPFMTHDDFWWMGMIRRDVNNWTPWILSNVIDTLLLTERDRIRRDEGLARAMRMLDSYLAVLPADGGCDEGAGYFNMAGVSLFDCLESLYLASDGRVSFYDEAFIRRIGEFPVTAHIHGPYFLNFADCDAKPILDGERLYRFGLRTGSNALQQLGASVGARRTSVRPADTPQMNRVLAALFESVPAAEPAETDGFSQLPELQVFTWRKTGLFLAAKGGHNGESHNHNDVGSFILYADGEPCVVDAGNMVYTAKTFSDVRYTLFNTRSRNHNLPLIGGREQCEGAAYAARDVQADETGLSLDIGGAYPEEAGVSSLVRTLRLTADGAVLHDEAALREAQPVTWVFMLRQEPDITAGEIRFGGLTLCFDAALEARVEKLDVTDARMARSFPGSLWRLTLTAAPSVHHDQTFAFKRS